MRKTILIVDDDEFMREALKEGLLAEGYEISEAANGNEAMKKVWEVSPDIIILDLEMPVMNGREFLKQTSKIKDFRRVPVIVYSGAIESFIPEEPNLNILSKTTSLKILIDTIERLLAAPTILH
jgi:CheY-like chemotaxis protein